MSIFGSHFSWTKYKLLFHQWHKTWFYGAHWNCVSHELIIIGYNQPSVDLTIQSLMIPTKPTSITMLHTWRNCRICNWRSQAFSLYVFFVFWESTHAGDHAMFFAGMIVWAVAKLSWLKVWSVESSLIHSKQTPINSLLWNVLIRSVINALCGHWKYFMLWPYTW